MLSQTETDVIAASLYNAMPFEGERDHSVKLAQWARDVEHMADALASIRLRDPTSFNRDAFIQRCKG